MKANMNGTQGVLLRRVIATLVAIPAAAGIVWTVGACFLFKIDGHGKPVADGWGRPFHDTPAFVKWLKAIVGLNPDWVGWAWASFDFAIGVLSLGLAAYAVAIWRVSARAKKELR
jgi:hypothetical protein